MNALKTAQATTIVLLALASLTACQRRDETATGAAGTSGTASTTPGGSTSGTTSSSGTATTPAPAASAASQ